MAKLETLVDNFNTGTINSTRWPTVASGVIATGGKVQITDSTGAYPALQSAATYDPVSSYLLAQVSPAARSGTDQSQQTYLGVVLSSGNHIGMAVGDTHLYWYKTVAGVETDTAIGTYNATSMAWWRIRHDGTGFVFGYSADGATWTETSTITSPFTLTTTMSVMFMVGKWSSGDPSAVGTIDNVNTVLITNDTIGSPPTPTPGNAAAGVASATATGRAAAHVTPGRAAAVLVLTGGAAPPGVTVVPGAAVTALLAPQQLHQLTDAFAATLDTTRWPVRTAAVATGGHAQLTVGSGSTTPAVLQSATIYDARNDAATVQVTTITPAGPDTSQQTIFAVGQDDNNNARMWRDQDTLYFAVSTGGVDTVSTAPFDPAADLWWRIRFDTSHAYFSTSSDGFTFGDDTGTSTAVTWSLSAVRLTLSATQRSSADPGGVAVFDNVNLAPAWSADVTPTTIGLAITAGSPGIVFVGQPPAPPVYVPSPVLPGPRRVGRWTYLLADLLTNAILAEVPLSGANPTKQLGAAGTCSGSIPTSRVVRGDPYTLTTPARTVLYVLYDGQPYWGGIIWTRRFSRSSGTVDIGASDWWSYYDHRKIVQIPDEGTDDILTAHRWTSYTSTDENDIARGLLTLAHSYAHGDIGVIAQNTMSGQVLPLTAYSGYSLTNVGKALSDLAQLTNGPDLMFDTSGFNSSGQPQRILRIGTPMLGDPTRPLVLEYGANLLDYTWSSDGTKFTTRMWATGSGQDEGTMMVRADNATRFAQGWPLLEDSNSYPDVFDVSQLQAKNASDLNAARLPVVTPSLTVRLTGAGLTEIVPGVQVRVIINDDFFRDGLDTTMRVVSVAPSTDGDTIAVTVNPTTEDVV